MTWLSSHVEQYAAQQEFIGQIERRGGAAEIEPVDWLNKSFGADFAQLVSRVVGLRISGPEFGDDTIADVLSERQMFANLHWLDLSGSRLTDGRGPARDFAPAAAARFASTQVGRQAADLVKLLPHLNWIGLPPRAAGPLCRLLLGWRRRGLHWARDGEKCETAKKPDSRR